MKAISKLKNHRKIITILSIITFLWIAFGAATHLTIRVIRNNVIALEAAREQEHYEKVLNNIFREYETIKVFVETIGVDNLNQDDFDDFVNRSDFSAIGFVSLSIAPDGIIEYYYAEGYESDANLIGRNLLTDERDHVRESVEYAIDNDVIAIDGPFDLIQGGYGIVFRRAIYEDGEFVAITNLVVNREMLAAIFDESKSDMVDVGVYKTDDSLIFGNLTYSNNLLSLNDINVQNVDWRIGFEVTDAYQLRTLWTNVGLVSLSLLLYFSGMFYAIRIYLRNQTLIKDQEYMINYDKLTLLPNRRSLMNKVDELIKTNKPFYLGFGDLDNFKTLNDIMGHSIGDEYLKIIADRFVRIIDQNISIYRWGGDEFIFIVAGSDKDQATRYFDKIYEIFEAPVEIRDVDYSVSISIGVVSYPRHGITIDDLIKRADIVMYDVKAQSKNTYNFFENRYLDNLQRQVDFENKINKFTMDDFEVYLQPILDVETNEIFGFEALSRLFDENGKSFNIIDVIKVLERKGQIPILDQHLFESLCKIKQRMNKEFNHKYNFSFNVSPLSLSEEFVQFLQDKVAEYGLEPKHFILEIIETIGFKEINEAVKLLAKLKKIGFQIAMDDFGMGYSSLSYIAKLPLSIVKIDRYFISNYYDNELDRLLIFAIRDVSKSLKLDIVVEGIETTKQLEFIKKLGAQYYQGYIHSKPMKLEDLIRKMKEGF